ncbi:hypothetical protein R70006_05046 [Paraburkholderia domus]|uniref:hypothetical protein n=1 Tax=Paraburkholderia domus TaxID=2793075 RepID=UPI00191252D0|nr:hypothetical protein [Paraburkholderia domus]MBK5051717.1 hypothetical protein [Burkholderia sp. R-70006]CAE6795334.1 hypothetical protein R70006_05046 [Paraburkholderia domus]
MNKRPLLAGLDRTEILVALTSLGEDPTASRVDALHARIDAATLPAGERADVVRAAVDAVRTQLDASGAEGVKPSETTHVEEMRFRSVLKVPGAGFLCLAGRPVRPVVIFDDGNLDLHGSDIDDDFTCEPDSAQWSFRFGETRTSDFDFEHSLAVTLVKGVSNDGADDGWRIADHEFQSRTWTDLLASNAEADREKDKSQYVEGFVVAAARLGDLHLCSFHPTQAEAEGAMNVSTDSRALSVVPAKVRFAENGNIRYWRSIGQPVAQRELPQIGKEYRSTEFEDIVVVKSVSGGRVYYEGDADGSATLDEFLKDYSLADAVLEQEMPQGLDLYNVTLDWEPGDEEQGDYATSAWARSEDEAIRRVAEEMANSNEVSFDTDEERAEYIERVINGAGPFAAELVKNAVTRDLGDLLADRPDALAKIRAILNGDQSFAQEQRKLPESDIFRDLANGVSKSPSGEANVGVSVDLSAQVRLAVGANDVQRWHADPAALRRVVAEHLKAQIEAMSVDDMVVLIDRLEIGDHHELDETQAAVDECPSPEM